MEEFIKNVINDANNAWEVYDKDYIKEQIIQQRPWTLTKQLQEDWTYKKVYEFNIRAMPHGRLDNK